MQDPIKQPTTGDLMADLHNKLAMRRKGISGIKEHLPNNPAPLTDNAPSMINLISALIPPPPKPHEAKTVASEDDEWE